MTIKDEKKMIFSNAVKMLEKAYWGELGTDNLTVLPELRKTLTPIEVEAAEAVEIAKNKVIDALMEICAERKE